VMPAAMPSVVATNSAASLVPPAMSEEARDYPSTIDASPAAELARLEVADWVSMLAKEAAQMLASGQAEVMDALSRKFESALIRTALKHTHGRKNDAAVRLGIGRNTITRKIQELGIADAKDE